MGNDGPDYSNVAAGGQVNVTHPLHVEQHEDGGEDEINLEGLSGSPADVGDASEATLAELKDRIGDETNPATGTSNKQLADILTELGTLLTELQLKADLTETQPVSAASLPLPASAATAANQATVIAAMLNRATLVVIYNVTITNANSEYSQALPANTKKFLIKCRGSYDIKVCFANGQSGTTYITVPGGMSYYEDVIQSSTLTLYFQCATAAQVAEIMAWS